MRRFHIWVAAVGAVALVSCGGDGGGGGTPSASAVGIDRSAAQTPSTKEEKLVQLSAAASVISGFDASEVLGGAGFKRALPRIKRAVVAVKLATAQSFDDSGEETVPCADGGSRTESYSVNGNQSGGRSTFETVYDNCDEFGYIVDGSERIVVSGDNSGNVEASVAIATVEQEVEGTTVVAEYRTAMEIDLKMEIEGLDDFAVAQDDPGDGFLVPMFRIEMDVNGSMSVRDDNFTCFDGTYVFETLSSLIIDENIGICGFSGGRIRLNNITYTFGPNTLTDGDGNEFSCAELTGSACAADSGAGDSNDGDMGSPGGVSDTTDNGGSGS